MNDHTLTVLEYRGTLSRLALHAQSEPGRRLVQDVFPRADVRDVQDACGVTAEALLLLEDAPPDLGQVEDTTDAVEVVIEVEPEYSYQP